MNYEERYKQALERAKESLNDGTISNIAIAYIQEIFPELAESEDKKMCVEIANFLRLLPHSEVGEKQDKWIAWLEKQGEQKEYSVWVGGGEINDEYLTKDEAEKLANEYKYKGFDDVVIEKQGEQKPVVIPKFRIGDTIKNPKNPQLIYHIKKIKNNKYMESDDAWVLIKEADEHYELVEQQPTQQSDKERMKTEIDWLYDSIDICICGLIKARKEKDTELEGKLLSSMESLMPQTIQFLDYLADFLDNNPKQLRKEENPCQ